MRKLLLLTVMCVLGLFGTLRAQETITIGEGTSINAFAVPCNTNYENTLSQQIYLADEFQGKYGEITSYAFKCGKTLTANPTVVRSFKIYMINTDKTSFENKTDWAAIQESDLVFEGSVTFEPKDAWTVVTLDTPFNYEEGKNLLICVNDVTGGYTSQVMTYYSTSTEEARSLYAYRDGAAYDAVNNTVSAYADPQYYVGQAQFTIKASSSGEDVLPTINLEAESASETSIALTWETFEGAASYGIYSGTETIAENLTETTYTVEGLEANTNYCYVVKAYDAESTQVAASEVTCATTLDYVITAPTNVAVTPVDPYSLEITWDAVEGATSYNIYWGDVIIKEGLTETSFVVEDLIPDVQYFFVVSALRGDVEEKSEGTWGETASIDFEADDLASEFMFDFNDQTFDGLRIIDADGDGNSWIMSSNESGYDNTYAIRSYSYYNYQPVTPDNFVVTKVPYSITSTSVVTLNAKCGMGFDSDLNEHYAVVVSENAKDWTVVFEETIDHKEWTNTSVSLAEYAGKNVLVGIRHYNCTGLYFLTVDNFALTSPILEPATPVNLVAEALSATEIKLTWDAAENALSYNVYNGEEKVANVTETTYTVTGLDSYTEYSFTVTSVRDEQESETSAAATAKTLDLTVAVPANLVAEALSTSEIKLTWDAAENALSYNVYNGEEKVANVTEATYTVAGLEYNTEYTFIVTAVRNEQESDKAEVVAKTLGESISENANGFNIYPNPVNDKLYIETEMTVEEVSVYDMFGRQQTIDYGQQTIDVTELNSGIYFVKVRTDNGETVKRFIKK